VGLSFGNPITVSPGTSVIWKNQSDVMHSVVWDSHAPDSSPGPGNDIPPFLAGGASLEWIAPAVTTSTTYNYHCGIHGTMMSGQIIVNP
jgi:plastocyanin